MTVRGTDLTRRQSTVSGCHPHRITSGNKFALYIIRFKIYIV
jgi:hypothetical protein